MFNKKKWADEQHNKQYKAEYKLLKSKVANIRHRLLPNEMYKKNPNLKKAGVELEYTPEQVLEIKRCFKDPKYFINNYCYIVTLDSGLTKFNTRDYQDTLLDMMKDNTRVLVKFPRQSGKTVSTAAYVVWEIIFRPYSQVAILANKAKTAIGILQKVRIMYESLPTWIQVGVVEWNKGSIKLENGSCVEASATSSSAIRSMSISTLIIDEAAFVPKNIWHEFYASVYPTVSSSKKSKIFLISTPYGMNHFYKFWNEANDPDSNSEFMPFEIKWNDVPGRDDKFKQKVIAEFGKDYWDQEFECEFLGSAGTLIPGKKLKIMTWQKVIESKLNNNLKIYELPEKKKEDDLKSVDGKYVAIFDTGEGVGGDYSTVQVFRVDEKPYRQVATYANNLIAIREFPTIVDAVGHLYNDAIVIGENNTIGAAILDDLFYDFEYENIFYASSKSNKEEELNDQKMGIRMTSRSKSIGCSNLKTNIVDDHFLITDAMTIEQFSYFAKKGSSYQADAGKHDDLITPLVIFSYFLRHREWVDIWLEQEREALSQQMLEELEEELLPLGFVCDDGTNVRGLDQQEDFNEFSIF